MNRIDALAQKTGKPYELARTAYHEAGHLLAHIRLDIESGQTSIIPAPEDEHLGYAECEEHVFYGKTPDEVLETVKRNAWGVSAMAGFAALIVAGEHRDEAIQGADGDLACAGGLGDVETFKAEAICLLSQTPNQVALALLSEQLLTHGTIGPLYAEQIVEIADGDATMDDVIEALSFQGEQFIRE